MALPRPCGNFKRSYREDEAIFKTGFVRASVVIFIVLLSLIPLVANDYILYVVNLVFLAIVGAHGINILTGNTGLISLGHGAFIGIGGYTTAILASRGLPIWVTLPCAGFMAAAVGLLFGIPSLRLKGFYLAMSTMAAQFLMEYLFMNFKGLTGGAEGAFVDRPSVFGMVLNSDAQFYYLALVFAIVSTFATINLLRTRVGRAFIAIRGKDYAAELIGINLFKYKTYSFMISSFYAGVTGCLMTYYLSIITPRSFDLGVSIDYLAMIILGGLGTVRGAIYGASFVIIVPELLKYGIDVASDYLPIFTQIPSAFPAIRMFVFGAMIILVLIIEEKGMAQIWINIKSYWKLWPYSY
ncbi:MAG TPA: branched-chain amino acid ABC transporter permease [Desulfobacteraceae bacterium]|nr:branched-chain amino acid ABC transporter permease [Desulfobacteraceae bacterium]